MMNAKNDPSKTIPRMPIPLAVGRSSYTLIFDSLNALVSFGSIVSSFFLSSIVIAETLEVTGTGAANASV